MPIGTDAAALADVARRLDEQLDGMQASLTQLEAHLRRLDDSWDGDAQRAGTVALHQAHVSLSRMRRYATSLVAVARSHASAVESFEARRANAWRV